MLTLPAYLGFRQPAVLRLPGGDVIQGLERVGDRKQLDQTRCARTAVGWTNWFTPGPFTYLVSKRDGAVTYREGRVNWRLAQRAHTGERGGKPGSNRTSIELVHRSEHLAPQRVVQGRN